MQMKHFYSANTGASKNLRENEINRSPNTKIPRNVFLLWDKS